MNKRQNGFSLLHALLILVVIGIFGFAGWQVLGAQKQADESLHNAGISSEVVKQEKKEGPEEYKPVIPNGWKIYENSDYGFSFAYPKEWGSLERTNPGNGPDYDPFVLLYLKSGKIDQREEKGITGNLSVSVVSSAFKEFRTVKAGTPLEYVANDGGYWIASTKVDNEYDDLKPGDKVPVPIEKKVNGTVIFRIEGGYECVQNAEWWLATTKGIIQIAMPSFNRYVGESTGICSSTRQVSDKYWTDTYKRVLNSINAF